MNVHDTVTTAKMISDEAVLTGKMKLLDTYLDKFQTLITEVAKDKENWEMDTLMAEQEVLLESYEKLLLEFQMWVHGFNAAKIKWIAREYKECRQNDIECWEKKIIAVKNK